MLTRREDFEIWSLPGGAVDDGETPLAAAVREVEEETGVRVRPTRLVGLWSDPRLQNHTVVFAADEIGGEPRPSPGETIAVGWFPIDAQPEPFAWWQRSMIADAAAGVVGAVWTSHLTWPDVGGRAELYAARDASGLSRQEYYRRHLAWPQSEEKDLPLR